MMSEYLLAIETVGNLCGIALYNCKTESLILEYCIHEKNMHDAMLAELVRRAILDAGITNQDIAVIAVSEGPGSFTGVRIGMSFAKGWCADGTTKLIPVPTLSAMAFELISSEYIADDISCICIATFSHADKVYMQEFTKPFAAIGNPSQISFIELVNGITPTTLVAGSAQTMIQHNGKITLPRYAHSNPKMIATFAFKMMKEGFASNHLDADSQYHAEFVPTQKKEYE